MDISDATCITAACIDATCITATCINLYDLPNVTCYTEPPITCIEGTCLQYECIEASCNITVIDDESCVSASCNIQVIGGACTLICPLEMQCNVPTELKYSCDSCAACEWSVIEKPLCGSIRFYRGKGQNVIAVASVEGKYKIQVCCLDENGDIV